MDLVGKIKGALHKSPLKKQLSIATNDESWGPSYEILQDIADHSYNYDNTKEIMDYLVMKLKRKSQPWQKVYKTLKLIEYLFLNGSTRIVQALKDELELIKTYKNFRLVEKGDDKGRGVRTYAERIIDLATYHEKLEEEREKAKDLKTKVVGGGNNTNTAKNINETAYAPKYAGFGPNQGAFGTKAPTKTTENVSTNFKNYETMGGYDQYESKGGLSGKIGLSVTKKNDEKENTASEKNIEKKTSSETTISKPEDNGPKKKKELPPPPGSINKPVTQPADKIQPPANQSQNVDLLDLFVAPSSNENNKIMSIQQKPTAPEEDEDDLFATDPQPEHKTTMPTATVPIQSNNQTTSNQNQIWDHAIAPQVEKEQNADFTDFQDFQDTEIKLKPQIDLKITMHSKSMEEKKSKEPSKKDFMMDLTDLSDLKSTKTPPKVEIPKQGSTVSDNFDFSPTLQLSFNAPLNNGSNNYQMYGGYQQYPMKQNQPYPNQSIINPIPLSFSPYNKNPGVFNYQINQPWPPH